MGAMLSSSAFAAASGCSAVLLGAFGAHALKGIEPALAKTWDTAAHYHLLHSVMVRRAATFHARVHAY